MISPKPFGPLPSAMMGGAPRRSTGGGLRGLLASRRPSLEEDSGTRERFIPTVYQYNPLLPPAPAPSLPGLDNATDAIASTATPERDVPSAEHLTGARQSEQTAQRNAVGQMVRSQPDQFQRDLRFAQTLVKGLRTGDAGAQKVSGLADLFRSLPGGTGPLRADLSDVLEDFGPTTQDFSGARATSPSPSMPPGERSNFRAGDVSTGLAGVGSLLGLLSALTDGDRADASRAIGAAQGLAGLTQAGSRLSSVQNAAPGLAGAAGGAAGLAGGALGVAGGAYGLSQGDPAGLAGIASGGLTLAGAAGATPAAAAASAGAGGGLAGAGAGMAAMAAPAAVIAIPALIQAIVAHFASQPEQAKQMRDIKYNLGEVQRTRQMASGLAEVFQSRPFAEAIHARMPGEEQDTTIGEVLRAIAERNVRGNFATGQYLWEPNPRYGALIAALDEMGVPRGRYDGAKAEHLVAYAAPGHSNSYESPASGGAFWDQILGQLTDHVLQADPALADRGPKAPPRGQWMRRLLGDVAFPGPSSPGQPRGLADILGALDPEGPMGQTGQYAEQMDPRIQSWWQEMAKRTKYQPGAAGLARLAQYRDDVRHGSA